MTDTPENTLPDNAPDSAPEIPQFKIEDEYAFTKWLEKPTDEIPEVAEWFYTYFFRELLGQDRFLTGYFLRQNMIKFTSMTEKITAEEATAKIDKNIEDWCSKHSLPYENKTYMHGEDRDWKPYCSKFYDVECPNHVPKASRIFKNNPNAL